MLGVYLCCRAVVPRMLERGRGRIVITGSGVRLSSRLDQKRVCVQQGGHSGRYLHAEHDPPEQLEARVDEILERDLNAIRLRR